MAVLFRSNWEAFPARHCCIAGQFDAVPLSDLSKLAQGCGVSVLSRDAQTSLLKVIFSTSSGKTLRDAGEIMWTLTHNLSSISWASSRVCISKTPHLRTTRVRCLNHLNLSRNQQNDGPNLFIYRSEQRRPLSVMLWHHQRDDKDMQSVTKAYRDQKMLRSIHRNRLIPVLDWQKSSKPYMTEAWHNDLMMTDCLLQS